MVTDEQVEERAQRLTMEANPPYYLGDEMYVKLVYTQQGYLEATILRLKDARESLRLLEELHEIAVSIPEMCEYCEYIAELKELLGITKDTDQPFTPESK